MNQPTMSSSERYRRLSRRAGIVCSASFIMVLSEVCMVIRFGESAPRWIAIPAGLGLLGSLISSVVCITASCFGAVRLRKESAKNDTVRPVPSRSPSPQPPTGQSLMKQSIGQVALVVREYDEAIAFFVGALGLTLVEDASIPEQDKRWVIVAPPGASGSRLLLARAVGGRESRGIGNQTGGRVFLFLHTDDFWRDFHAYKARGIVFVREPKEESYGTVAVFKDLYGNLWDLVQPNR